MENRTDWEAHLKFNSTRKCNRETHLLCIDCVRVFESVARKKKQGNNSRKGFPTHLIRTVQSMYQSATIIVDRLLLKLIMEFEKFALYHGYCLICTSTKPSKIGCRWQAKYFRKGLNSKYSLIRGCPGDRGKYRRWAAESSIYAKQCGYQICFGYFSKWGKGNGLEGETNMTTKVVINDNIIEHVNRFNYLGNTITVWNKRYLEKKREEI